jgi:DNA polymerase-3 subunit gamma/tau
MKIASLGKKKNNDDSLIEEEYTLPTLPDTITPAGGVAVQSTTAPIPSAAPNPVVATPAREQVASLAPQTTPSVKTVATPVENVVLAASEVEVRKVSAMPTMGTSSVAGLSIASMMSAMSKGPEPQTETKETVAAPTQYDPQSESKIEACRTAVVDTILQERPRFVVAFETMVVRGHTIIVEVPSQTLYEEIMRSKTELLLAIARTAGVTGSLELEVKVNEQVRATRPIKLEDRIQHMNEKNPLLLELKRELDMEYE